jgi:predicted O-methyltransferase YrrM
MNSFKTVLEEYHARIEVENALMRSLPMVEGMKRRDEFLLSVGEETAIFLNHLIKASKPKNILELGTSYGYSTLWLADAAQTYGGKVITLELDEKKVEYAENQLKKAGLSDNVEFIIGDVLKFLEETSLQFEFVLLDIWKELYISSFDLFLPKLQSNAYVISDNMIFPPHSKEEMDVYRRHLKKTGVFDSVLLPIGSGLEVSHFVNGN